MKLAPMLLVAVSLPLAGLAHAAADGQMNSRFSSTCCDTPARWAPRQDTDDARLAITSTDGDLTLLITDKTVAFQLSDRTLKRMRKKLRETEDEDDDNVIGQAIKVALMSTIRQLISHSAECPIPAIRSVDLNDGRLAFTGEDGQPVFGHLQINDRDEMSAFDPREAKAFIQEFRRVKGRAH